MASSVSSSTPRTRRSQGRNRVFLVILVVLLLFFLVSYVDLVVQNTALREEIGQAAARLQDSHERGLWLEQQLRYIQSDAYKETVARDQLGMARAGDNVFGIMTDPAADMAIGSGLPAVPPSVGLGDLPIWQQWAQLFNLDIELP